MTLDSTPALEDGRPEPLLRAPWVRTCIVAAVAIVVILLGLRLLHLNADFPNHSRWADDGAKYTDEGWYVSAALNSMIWGHWYLPGDWAPAVIMPVWPVLVRGVWAVTGVSAAAARGLEVLFSYAGLLLAWWLARRNISRRQALAFALLLGASAFEYAFSRLAILEMPMVAAALGCLLITTSFRTGREIWLAVMFGISLPLLVLTKSTGVFLLPAIFYPIWFRFRHNWRAALRPMLIAGVIAAGIYGSEQILFASHYRADAKVFFSHSQGVLQLVGTSEKTARFFFRGVTWIDPILFPIALAGLVASWWMRELWDNVLWGVSVLWSAFFAFFIVYHFDGPPRYFGTMTIPVFLMAVMFTTAVWRRRPAAGRAMAALCCVAFVWNAGMIVRMSLHPTYQLRDAAAAIRAVVEAHPEQSHVLMGHGATQVELMDSVPAVNDVFGTMTEAQKVAYYHPGWIVIWNDETLDGLGDVSNHNILQPVATYPVFDQPERNMLRFFRVVPKKP